MTGKFRKSRFFKSKQRDTPPKTGRFVKKLGRIEKYWDLECVISEEKRINDDFQAKIN